MKALLKLNILFLVVLVGLLSSCKKNDGYSDKIETNIVPVDSTETPKDTTANAPSDQTNIETTQSAEAGTTARDESKSTEGTGSGPGESVQDGSTYTPAKGVQKDSVKLQTESAKKRKNK
ncbi:hypothetical protein [Flavobacterium sp. ACN6]|uniref:hypothetical protein n=1 Tax=Flavobacterium sp. ACN6 TaxID=1920426 RepID=UPI000BB38EA8|nr:hypothetical protein [Flavobacterium sp. ACN6]PBJ14377.1 hypothetical protein BSF42_07950 [Flavobacterium sp. ACN6]